MVDVPNKYTFMNGTNYNHSCHKVISILTFPICKVGQGQ